MFNDVRLLSGGMVGSVAVAGAVADGVGAVVSDIIVAGTSSGSVAKSSERLIPLLS